MLGTDLTIAYPIVSVSADPGPRAWCWLTTDITSGIVPKTVNATIHDEGFAAGDKTYELDWGDGTTAGPQASNTFSHTYTVGGVYDITPTVELAA